MRHFPEMTGISPRKEIGKAKPLKKESNPALWHDLACLAVDLGFRTKEALRLQRQDPDEALASQFLQHAELTAVMSDERYVKSIARIVKRARQATRSGGYETPGSSGRQPIDRSADPRSTTVIKLIKARSSLTNCMESSWTVAMTCRRSS